MEPPVTSNPVIVAAFLACVTALGCKDDFPDAPPLVPVIEAVAWPDTVAVADTDTLRLAISLPGSHVAGLEVTWQSSDPSKLELLPLPVAGQHEDSLVADLKVIAVAHARDSAVTITVTVNRPGFAPTVMQRAIRIMERWTAVSVGGSKTCALSVSQDAYCWGIEYVATSFSTDTLKTPTLVRGNRKFQSISSGGSATCGLADDGLSYCWGENLFGQLGDNTQLSRRPPAPVTGGNFVAVFAGGDFACGVREDHTAQCWGDQMYGQLGQGPVFSACIPYSDWTLYCRPGLASGADVRLNIADAPFRPYCAAITQNFFAECNLHVVSLSLGQRHACATSKYHAVFCWGAGDALGGPLLGNTCSRITDGISGACSSWPTMPGQDSGFVGFFPETPPLFVAVSSGSSHTCGLTTAGQVFCWGNNAKGQLGDGSYSPSLKPTPGAPNFIGSTIAAGSNHTCALDPQGMASCWGENDIGQLGSGSAGTNSPNLVAVVGGHQFGSLSAGAKSTCGVTVPTGAIYCWGKNLGNGTTNTSSVPTRIAEPL